MFSMILRRLHPMIGSLLAFSCCAAGCVQLQNLVPKAEIESQELVELSGVAPAGPGQYWGVNDSGHPPVLFRFDERGQILEKVPIPGAQNADWEALTDDATGNIYVADVGDNARRRGKYTIYVLPAENFSQVRGVILFEYEDGVSRDCEAVFAFEDVLYLISKRKFGEKAEVFRIDLATSNPSGDAAQPEPRPNGRAANQAAEDPAAVELKAQMVGLMPLSQPVTDVAYSAERREIAVLTYLGAILFRFEKEEDFAHGPMGQVPGFFGISEGIAYTSEGQLLITNESGALWKIPLEQSGKSP